jgi:uncharacterized membrane protein YsdA (DUF1294 family)/cold shock CspA family protein
MRYQGKITTWKDDQGFGFITPNLGGEPVFVHIKAFANRSRRPVANEIVTYELANDAQGRLQARQVAHVTHVAQGAHFGGRRAAPARASGPSRSPLAIAGLFLVFIAFGGLTARLPLLIVGLYAGASLITFIAYAFDKSAAQSGSWRTQENTLHLLALIGGWPGALIAQNRLRHKSRKTSFQVVFWATALLNCGGLAWLLKAPGGQALRLAIGIT